MTVSRRFTVPSKGVGLPDYSAPKPTGAVPVGSIYTSTDIGELAARLGSPIIFERRGNVVFIESFEGNLRRRWYVGKDPGVTVEQTAERARIGDFSLKIHTPVGAPASGFISTRIPYLTVGNIGIEFTLARGYYPHWATLNFTIYTGTHGMSFVVSCPYLGTNDLTIDHDGGRAIIAEGGIYTVGPAYTSYFFRTIKVVIDCINRKFLRLILDGVYYDLSAYTLTNWADNTPPYMEPQLYARASDDGENDVYFDSLIITRNEPPND